jgi:hypothetical protein
LASRQTGLRLLSGGRYLSNLVLLSCFVYRGRPHGNLKDPHGSAADATRGAENEDQTQGGDQEKSEDERTESRRFMDVIAPATSALFDNLVPCWRENVLRHGVRVLLKNIEREVVSLK